MRTKSAILIFSLVTCFNTLQGQVVSISNARALGPGSNVKIKGIITNGSELGTIRYMQDTTGGMAVYNYNFGQTVIRGDSVTVSGTIKNYNNLLELDPVSSWIVDSSGNALPSPVVITPSQLGESYESQLVKIEKVTFADGGNAFSSGTYTFSGNAQSGIVYVRSGHPLIGEVIPSGEVSLTGICHQHYSTYELLLRDKNDILLGNSINLTSPVTLTGLSQSGFTLHWTTDMPGTSEIKYGNTPGLELGILTDATNTTNHNFVMTGRSPSEILYIQAFSTDGSDTAFSSIRTYITQSASTGAMIAYFNRTLDLSVSAGTDAIQLDQTIDDTLIRYIDRAKYTIDLAIYNFNNTGISNISTALNNAHGRGVEVRIVYDSNTDNAGISQIDGAIGKITSPVSNYPDYGIMHNKFVVFDANSPDTDDAIVWTGSTNFTSGQINTDPNNVIIIQDQSLAKTYRLEFDEMFGSSGLQPDPAKSKFGPDKTDNTPHEFIIGGKRVECYFSPSDGTNSKILTSINSANTDLSVATMIPTRTDLGYAIRDRAGAGVTGKVLVNNDSDPNMQTNVNTLSAALGTNFRKSGESGIMHHKYLIVDQSDTGSDPLVLTGSHNWSNSAEYRNDENTVVIHDSTIANIYYQEFSERFKYGQIIIDAPVCNNDYVTTDLNVQVSYDVTANDQIPGSYILSKIRDPRKGTASVNLNKEIVYTPDAGYTGLDTVTYEVCLTANSSLCDSAWMVILISDPTSVDEILGEPEWTLHPNPADEILYLAIDALNAGSVRIEILDLSGKIVISLMKELSQGRNHLELNTARLLQGLYLIKLQTDQNTAIRKLIIR